MTQNTDSVINQLRRNTVALVSIVIAVSSLSYNTWRNEVTEDNRNQRFAAFEMLLKLNELQQVIFHSYYDRDSTDKGNPRTGWSYVLTVRDLSRVLYPPLPASADKLLEVWGENWEEVGEKQASVDLIMVEIDNIRNETLLLLESLE
ncbi:MAG: hypothetical protein RQ982_05910 [Gammaproteobacteria bacterium]|nr:hypothetical protein [Gammaproteobacteria bacterium]